MKPLHVCLANVVLLACTSKDPPPPTAQSKFETFALDANAVVLRPYMCQRLTMRVQSTPIIEPDDIVWSADPAIEIRPDISNKGSAAGPTESRVMLCAGGQSGKFKFKAELKGRAGYYADGGITVGLPDPKTGESNPLKEVMGAATQDYLRIGWEDANTLWAFSRDQTVVRVDATSLKTKSAFSLRGMTDAVPMGDRRWFVRINKVNNAIYDERGRSFESWFASGGLDDQNYHELGAYEPYNANQVIASSWAKGRALTWLYGDQQNAAVCRMTLLDMNRNERRPFNWASTPGFGIPMAAFPPEMYTELSASGRYLAYGVGGCATSLPANGLFDTETNTSVRCGDDPRTSYAARPVFASGESALAKVVEGKQLSVYDVPTCNARGHVPAAGGHLGFALSPDGNRLAHVVDGPAGFAFAEYNTSAGSARSDGSFAAVRGFEATVGDYNASGLIEPLSARLAYSPDGTQIAVGLADGHIAVVHPSEGTNASVTTDAQFSGNILWTWLSPNGRYLGLQASTSGWGVYDLAERHLMVKTSRIVAVEDTQVIVYDAGALKNKVITFDNLSVVQDYNGTPPTRPSESDVCSVREGGNRVCHVDGQERCIDFIGQTKMQAFDARFAGTSCAVLTDDAIYTWVPGSTAVSRAAFLTTRLPSSQQGPILGKFIKLPEGRLLVATNRLEIWQP